MDTDGKNAVQIADAEEDFDPAITPDGQTVVYASIAPQVLIRCSGKCRLKAANHKS